MNVLTIHACNLFCNPAMPRRSVKTIDSNVDLSTVFRMADELPKPWNIGQLFAGAAQSPAQSPDQRGGVPLELEIGSGKGLFIAKAAGHNPMHNFLGIEISVKYARFSAARLLRQNRSNAVIVCGDAALILRDWIPQDTLAAVHVYFPDPWWKRAHRKRRILRTEVLQLIESRLVPGGALHFWTDVEEYFTSTLDLLATATTLQGPFDVPESEAADDWDYRTHFERRTRLHGETVYRTLFKKSEDEISTLLERLKNCS